jgi:hypothetical protein
MRLMKYLVSFTVVAIVLSLGAFAKDRDSGSFDLGQTARVGTAVLQPGHYKVEWTGPNNALHISIVQNGKTVATTQGQLKELPAKAPYDAIDIKAEPDNSHRVEEIDFNNRTEALQFTRM